MLKNFLTKLLRKVILRVTNFPRWLLVSVFDIGPFHISTLKSKPYCVDIIRHLNKRDKKESALDIGCGLGDVLRNLNYTHRYGLDRSEGFLSALEFIQKFSLLKERKLILSTFNFEDDEISGSYDVIVICNWIHKFQPDYLRQKFEKMYKFNLNHEGEIIFDIIERATPFHPYAHSVENLNSLIHAQVTEIGRYIIKNSNFEILHRQVLSLKKI